MTMTFASNIQWVATLLNEMGKEEEGQVGGR